MVVTVVGWLMLAKGLVLLLVIARGHEAALRRHALWRALLSLSVARTRDRPLSDLGRLHRASGDAETGVCRVDKAKRTHALIWSLRRR